MMDLGGFQTPCGGNFTDTYRQVGYLTIRSRNGILSSQMPKKLLFSVRISDCRVDTFRCPGNGGQNVNKVETGVRIVHAPSGAVGQSCDERTQGQNKKIAFRRMAESKEFKAWHLRVTSELLTGKTVEQRVEEAMEPSNVKVEVRREGRWVAE